MKSLYPDFVFNRVWEIDKKFIEDHGVMAIILDVDNTLTPHGSQELDEKTTEWLLKTKMFGVSLLILSNNTPERIKPFADKCGVDFLCGIKPKKSDYKKALLKLGTPPENTVGVGDQIFTDVLGANLSGLISVLTHPIDKNETRFIKLKRIFEKPFVKGVKK